MSCERPQRTTPRVKNQEKRKLLIQESLTTFASGRYIAGQQRHGRHRQVGAATQFSFERLLVDSSQESYHLELAQLNSETGIGKKLRLAREARGIPLRDISDQTRISMRYLTAIESDEYKRLPGGIFNRSFIRAYAKHIGYDEDAAVSEYANMVRDQSDSPDDVATKPYKSRVYEGTHSNRSPVWTLLLAILILAALSLTVWAGLHFYQRRTAPRTQPRSMNRGRLPDKMTRARQDKLIAIRDATVSWKGGAKGGQNGFNV